MNTKIEYVKLNNLHEKSIQNNEAVQFGVLFCSGLLKAVNECYFRLVIVSIFLLLPEQYCTHES